MKTEDFESAGVTALACTLALEPVRDALYVLNGKWKLPIIISMVQGNKRFGEIRRAVDKISAKVLSHELKELEINGFLIRKVHHAFPESAEYVLTEYSTTLGPVLIELQKWGVMHREKIMTQTVNKNQDPDLHRETLGV
jgi:DNA-binding HxlR family transcriptional regulator